jgi:HAD superfamily hydrolase (TIGR01509 family)
MEMLLLLVTAQWRVGVVTNGGVKSQSEKLENTGLFGVIHHAVISDAVGVRKPAPAMFDRIVIALDIDAERSWFIGDDPTADIWGAKQYGFRTMWIQNNAQWPGHLPESFDVKLVSAAMCYEHLQRTL